MSSRQYGRMIIHPHIVTPSKKHSAIKSTSNMADITADHPSFILMLPIISPLNNSRPAANTSTIAIIDMIDLRNPQPDSTFMESHTQNALISSTCTTFTILNTHFIPSLFSPQITQSVANKQTFMRIYDLRFGNLAKPA